MQDKLPYGFCGMPCALCPYYHTKGVSRCKGCSHDGFFTGSCGIYKCCKKDNINHCALCINYPCFKCEKLKEFNCLDTNNAWQITCNSIKEQGFEKWYSEYHRKAELLQVALDRYNNGKMKRFLCELFITHELACLEDLMREAASLSGSRKEVSKSFKELATQLL